MTAHAIIEQIKALPPEEQAEVVEFVVGISGQNQIHTLDSARFKETSEKVLERHEELMRKLSH